MRKDRFLIANILKTVKNRNRVTLTEILASASGCKYDQFNAHWKRIVRP